MRSQRTFLVLGIALAAAAIAAAQSTGTLRWRSGGTSLGLQPSASSLPIQCGPFSLACDSSSVVPLYASSVTTRSLSLQVGSTNGTALKLARSQGLSLAVLGKAGFFSDFGVYGRVGTTAGRGSAFSGTPASESGTSYGVGLSWDFSRSASAVLGFDSYDLRGMAGEPRDVRATSLGLQWRY